MSSIGYVIINEGSQGPLSRYQHSTDSPGRDKRLAINKAPRPRNRTQRRIRNALWVYRRRSRGKTRDKLSAYNNDGSYGRGKPSLLIGGQRGYCNISRPGCCVWGPGISSCNRYFFLIAEHADFFIRNTGFPTPPDEARPNRCHDTVPKPGGKFQHITVNHHYFIHSNLSV